MNTSLKKRMKEPEDENRRLKKMYAEERVNSEIRKNALGWQIVPIAQSE
jgi:putative transposase